MNEIKANSQFPQTYFNVVEPSAAVIAEAQRLNAAHSSNAKLLPSGNVCFRNDFKSNIETMIRREAADSLVAPNFEKIEAMENWVYENIGGKVAQELAWMTAKQFNQNCAGLTIAQIKAKVS